MNTKCWGYQASYIGQLGSVYSYYTVSDGTWLPGSRWPLNGVVVGDSLILATSNSSDLSFSFLKKYSAWVISIVPSACYSTGDSAAMIEFSIPVPTR